MCGSAGFSSSCSGILLRSVNVGSAATSRSVTQRGAVAHRHARAVLGRRLVPTRLFRRRNTAGVRAERGMQDRLATQSWAVLSQTAQPQRAERAMEAVRAHLVRRDAGLVLLLTPPFDRTAHDPGYIKGYLPGIRENGGQYTHAALWTVIALARLGQADAAMELFHMLNPINHMRTPEDVDRYRAEPVRSRGRRLRTSDARRAWRVDLVYGVRRMDVPGGDRTRSVCAGRRPRSR